MKGDQYYAELQEELDEKLGTLNWIPKIFTSVTDKKRIFQAIEMAVQVYENRIRKVPTSELNEAILPEIERYPPPALKGNILKLSTSLSCQFIPQLPCFL